MTTIPAQHRPESRRDRSAAEASRVSPPAPRTSLARPRPPLAALAFALGACAFALLRPPHATGEEARPAAAGGGATKVAEPRETARKAGGDATLEQAIAAYAAAQDTASAADRPAAFARAERLFAAAAAEGTAGADLWTDLGTAALQAEHLGSAVLAYRRALAIDPDHRHAQQNLEHARSLLPGWVPRPEGGGLLDSIVAWRHAMSAREREGAAAVVFLVSAAMIAGALATGSSALRLLSLFPLLAWGLLVVSETLAAADRGGVLTAPDTIARAADSRNAPARFREPLPAGTEVTVGEVRGAWSRVVLADGRDAWVSSSAVEPVSRR